MNGANRILLCFNCTHCKPFTNFNVLLNLVERAAVVDEFAESLPFDEAMQVYADLQADLAVERRTTNCVGYNGRTVTNDSRCQSEHEYSPRLKG